jgi:M-phase inducer tyrosine phosphatase
MDNPLDLEKTLFQRFEDIQFNIKNQIPIILYCEYSQRRCVEFYRLIRHIDRLIHQNTYPNLFYPEIYILQGGYSSFFQQFKV